MIDLVAGLDDVGHRAGSVERDQRIVSIAVKDLSQFLLVLNFGPGGGNGLLAAIGPPVRVMKIERRRQAGGPGSFQAARYIGEIAVFRRIAVGPDADARDIGAMGLKQGQKDPAACRLSR